MDMQEYNQYGLEADELDGLKDYLYEGLEDLVELLLDSDSKTAERSQPVTLEIVETVSGI